MILKWFSLCENEWIIFSIAYIPLMSFQNIFQKMVFCQKKNAVLISIVIVQLNWVVHSHNVQYFHVLWLYKNFAHTDRFLMRGKTSTKPSSVISRAFVLGFWVIISYHFWWLYFLEWVMWACFPPYKVRTESSMIPWVTHERTEMQTGKKDRVVLLTGTWVWIQCVMTYCPDLLLFRKHQKSKNIIIIIIIGENSEG